MGKKQKLKRAVVKEELVALTGNFLKALILNQFLYWGQRVQDFDQFILEEQKRDPSTSIELTHGWIYKSSEKLTDELMIDTSARTTRRRLEELVESGFLDRRHNPRHKWDQCWQYRPNLRFIQQKLQELGYTLAGYPLLLPDHSIGQGVQSNGQDVHSSGQDVHALPETTTETTVESTTEQQRPKLDHDFGVALSAYHDAFGPLGSSHLHEKFQTLWDEYPSLAVHAYARKEMYQAMMDDRRRVRPNLAYYARCLATGTARAEGKPGEQPGKSRRRNAPKREVVDLDDPDVQEWLAERSASGGSDQLDKSERDSETAPATVQAHANAARAPALFPRRVSDVWVAQGSAGLCGGLRP